MLSSLTDNFGIKMDDNITINSQQLINTLPYSRMLSVLSIMKSDFTASAPAENIIQFFHS